MYISTTLRTALIFICVKTGVMYSADNEGAITFENDRLNQYCNLINIFISNDSVLVQLVCHSFADER